MIHFLVYDRHHLPAKTWLEDGIYNAILNGAIPSIDGVRWDILLVVMFRLCALGVERAVEVQVAKDDLPQKFIDCDCLKFVQRMPSPPVAVMGRNQGVNWRK